MKKLRNVLHDLEVIDAELRHKPYSKLPGKVKSGESVLWENEIRVGDDVILTIRGVVTVWEGKPMGRIMYKASHSTVFQIYKELAANTKEKAARWVDVRKPFVRAISRE